MNNLNDEGQNPSTENLLLCKQFCDENYVFRFNILSNAPEYAVKNDKDGQLSDFLPLTEKALNSIIFRATSEGILEKGDPKPFIKLYLTSDEIGNYNPIEEFLNALPQWDGYDHISELFARIPGLTIEQKGLLQIWFLSMVAHWQQMDRLHGNEIVPILIGTQGCGKTTFLRSILPSHLDKYYLDHLNLSNKFDMEMALTCNLLVNIDEYDSITRSQQPKLKQLISKNKVNGRPIFGTVQKDRPRFASLAATTNNPHPLTDTTGSRRFICLLIPEGMDINNEGEINYEQLYAQALHMLHEQKARYWFTNEEVKRIQELNMEFTEKKSMEELIIACFRKPLEGEKVRTMNSTEMLQSMRQLYPSVKNTIPAKLRLGRAMSELGFEKVHHSNIAYYKVVPLEAA